MRRQHFAWTYLVTAAVLTIYGGGALIYSLTHEKTPPLLGTLFLIIGLVLFTIFIVLYIVSIRQKKKAEKNKPQVIDQPVIEKVEEPKEEKKEEVKVEEKPVEKVEKPRPASSSRSRNDTTTYFKPRTASRSYSGPTVYVNQLGYGPVLRVEGPRILDMRTNTYYVIEDDEVMRQGSGPVYEISGSRIRKAYGSYLYELSGDSINKVFGGFYASISGNYLSTYDNSLRFEIGGSLSRKQFLVIAALLFGEY